MLGILKQILQREMQEAAAKEAAKGAAKASAPPDDGAKPENECKAGMEPKIDTEQSPP